MPRILALVGALVLGAVVLGQSVLAASSPAPHGRPRVSGSAGQTATSASRAAVATPKPAATATPKVTAPRAAATPRPTRVPAPAAKPDIAQTRLFGIDVSSHQGQIDWGPVADAGARFAFIRASAGNTNDDPTYAANTWGARGAGLTVGSYHFAYPDAGPDDAVNEANWFLANATIASGDLLPVLDLEKSGGLDPASLALWTQTWLTHVEAATGLRPIIYTNPSFWGRSVADIDWFARNRYPMWIAHWTDGGPSVPADGWAGQGWQFWQYTSYGSIPGISGRVDFNWSNGASIPSELLVP